MSGIQLVFANGVESPLFQAEKAKGGIIPDKLQSIKLDTSREIGSVKMGVKYGVYYNAIRVYDRKPTTIVKKVWRNSGSWTPT